MCLSAKLRTISTAFCDQFPTACNILQSVCVLYHFTAAASYLLAAVLFPGSYCYCDLILSGLLFLFNSKIPGAAGFQRCQGTLLVACKWQAVQVLRQYSKITFAKEPGYLFNTGQCAPKFQLFQLSPYVLIILW